MRLWNVGTGLAIGVNIILAGFLALSAPSQSAVSAGTMSSAELTALLQFSSPDGVQCHNNRTFCRADVSRCNSNERERQEWRTQCLAPYKARYDHCVNTRPALRPHNGAPRPERNAQCAHLANYEETQCQLEAQICPGYDLCEQQFGQCIRDQGAALRNRPQDGGTVPEPQPAPLPSNTPTARPSQNGAYDVRIRNRCDRTISVAYVYEDRMGVTRKSGWITISSGRSKRVRDPVDSNEFAIHSTIGFPTLEHRIGQSSMTDIVNDGFDAPVDQNLNGDGRRTVPFEKLRWQISNFEPEIEINYCDSYRWGEATRPIFAPQPQRPETRQPVISPEQARIEQLFRFVRQGSVGEYDRLVGEGVDPSARNQNGWTLFHAAAAAPISVINYDVTMLSRLEDAGLDPEATGSAVGSPVELALQRAIEFYDYDQSDHFAPSEPRRSEMLHFFVDRTQNLPIAGAERGLTLLHVAALNYDADLVEKLLERGFPTGVYDGFGNSARDYAEKKRDASFLALFPAPVQPAQSTTTDPGESRCTDVSLIPEGQLDRYRQLESQGVVKLCEPT
ncbi:MAG: ankyrin repeat domain-containing protein [Erythrobacter sp.]